MNEQQTNNQTNNPTTLFLSSIPSLPSGEPIKLNKNNYPARIYLSSKSLFFFFFFTVILASFRFFILRNGPLFVGFFVFSRNHPPLLWFRPP
jgi:hypothetical protein